MESATIPRSNARRWNVFDRFEDDARKSIWHARKEALRLRHDYIGSEHMLLGLLATERSVAAEVLRKLDLDLARIRSETEKRLEPGTSKVTDGQIPFTPRAKSVLELTLIEAGNLGHDHLGTGHLLLGLILQPEGTVAEVLRAAGVDLDAAREQVRDLEGPRSSGSGEASPASLAHEVRRLREENAALRARVADLEKRVRALEGGSS
jgi:ATP-dependent Clp protease ATP-binding subunit ClpC